MKKIKLFTLLLLTSVTFTSCDINEVMGALNGAADIYLKVKDASRGATPKITELKNVDFSTTRGQDAAFLNGIKDLNFTTFPGVDASFREQFLNDFKGKVDDTNIKHELCTNTQCVMSFKDKGLMIFNQNGNNLEAMVMKGKFDSAEINRVIKSGLIFNIKDLIK